MFTGIVRERGRVVAAEANGGGMHLRVEARETAAAARPGDSIAVAGCCLTATAVEDGSLEFDAVPETIARTNLGRLAEGAEVNLEPALRAGEPLGGHFVQGHVDGVGRVRALEPEGEGARLSLELDPELLRYCVQKGSLTVEGVALTVAAARRGRRRDRARPVHAAGDHALGAASRRRGQRRGRPAREVRRAARDHLRGTISADMDATERSTAFATVEEAIEDIRQGKAVVVVDAADRENEGDLTIAAQFATPEAINFMATHGRGLICLCLTEERCDELRLKPMAERNETPFGTAFTISIEAREGITTGISAPDRSRTIQVAIDPSKGPADLVQPGHVFPLRAKAGGVLRRGGQTEAAVDLARLAGLNPAGVVCEVMNDDGTMARVPDLIPYCAEHGLKLITVADLIEYRRRHEKLVERTTVGSPADGLRRVHRRRLPRDADGQEPPRAREGRGRRARRRPGARSL